jgi:hypothetical protein
MRGGGKISVPFIVAGAAARALKRGARKLKAGKYPTILSYAPT